MTLTQMLMCLLIDALVDADSEADSGMTRGALLILIQDALCLRLEGFCLMLILKHLLTLEFRC